ncbi:hypothetical protein DHD05_20770 [Arenibacter sp. N53]|nr:hypothetical protein [Arenibacter hampyeongensis]MCM4154030.1 hypothetical protein [Arenibacter sp. N53]
MYKRNVFIILLCLGFAAKAQMGSAQISEDSVFPKEIPKLVTNSDLLLCGERLNYKIYNLMQSGQTSSLSKISYVSLRTDNDSVIFNHKLRLENGQAQGTFFIPTSIKTGVYRLLGHTNFSLNNLENAVVHRKLYIINSYVKSTTSNNKDSTRTIELLSYNDAILDLNQQSPPYGLLIRTDKPSYKKRDRISLNIENPNGKFAFGNYVLSVRRIDPVDFSHTSGKDENMVIEKRNDFFIPELRGELISGRVVTSANKEAVANKVVAFSIPGKNYVFKSVKTDDTGHFYISIDEPYETRKCIIQIDEPDRERYEIILDNKELPLKAKGRLVDLKLDPSLKEWLQERSIQTQIENAYFTQDKEGVESGSGNPFYGDLGTAFILDDYTRFNSLEETFVEVVTLARIRNKEGKRAFQVFDPFSPQNSGPFNSLDPLLLMDGILVKDASEILAYSAKDIGIIRVFPKTYRYGPKIYRGIIDFSTKEENFTPRLDGAYIQAFELIRPLPEKINMFPDHSDDTYKRLPDYRTQLNWDPNIELLSIEMTHILYASDVSGTFMVTLEGFTKNGEHVEVHKRFKVE